jgi:hypothetical protein
MLFRETVAVYFEKSTEHINMFCGQNLEFLFVEVGGIYSDHCAVKSRAIQDLRFSQR